MRIAGKGVVEDNANQQGNGDQDGQRRGHQNLRNRIGRAEKRRIAERDQASHNEREP